MQTATVVARATGTDMLKPTRQHFEILDGLRGIAAIVVVIFHFLEIVYTDYSKNFAGHGFLAVDFFFCLSGFVIAYAYDDRIGKMGIAKFLRARLIRLHPLVIMGSVLGLLALFFDPFAAAAPAYSAGKVILIFLLSILVIPFPVMADRYFNLFGLNAPAWSLFWEYVANVVYGFILWRLDKRILLVMAVAAAVWLGYVGSRAGNVMGGWGKDSFWDGAARISFSFLAGMLVYRYNFIIKNKLGFTGLTILLLAALLMPWFKLNWLAEVLVVVLYFPLLIALGAGSTLHQRMEGICNFSGRISYPLYMTHYVVMWAFANYNQQHKPDITTVAWIVGCGVVVLMAFAYVVMVLYDEPVRKYLSGKNKQ